MKRLLAFVSLGIFLSVPSGGILRAAPSPVDEAREHLRALAGTNGAGLAVLVARDGAIVFQEGFGQADEEGKVVVTPETKFRIGSITKQFTAASAVRLAEQGKLSLSDDLAKYFPGFARGHDITLRHLMTHTSGLRSYTDKPDFLAKVGAPVTPADLIASFRDDPPDFAPGAGFHYNNSAYFLLGEIVAKVAGKPLGDVLREQFFVPLGMKDTGVLVNAAPPAGMARGYSWVDGKLTSALDWDMSWAGGAGALYSTVGDLFRWNEALFGGRVMTEVSFKAAQTPVELPPGTDGMSYGYGLVNSAVKRLPAIGHGGGLNGWASDLLRFPAQRCTIVVLTNALPSPPGRAPAEISHWLAGRFLADDIAAVPPLEEDPSVDPKTFAAFVGRFDYHGAIMSVTTDGEALFAELTGQPKFRIYPKSADEFFWKVADAQVVFVRNEKGEVVAARHTQNGNTTRAPKLGEEAISLTAAQLDAIVGKYQYGPGIVLTVKRDELQLMAQLTGQAPYPIFPRSDAEFEWRVVDARVRFVKGDDGKVSKAVHTQNGTSFDAPKTE